jgi:beta-phosphoglucomutase-like phosphatase (HAD superfamily)
MAKLEALIFDVDGTLADTENYGHRVAFNLAFLDAGLNWNWDFHLYKKLLSVTGGKVRLKFYVDEFQPAFDNQGNLSEFITELHKSKTQYYNELVDNGDIPLRSGVDIITWICLY